MEKEDSGTNYFDCIQYCSPGIRTHLFYYPLLSEASSNIVSNIKRLSPEEIHLGITSYLQKCINQARKKCSMGIKGSWGQDSYESYQTEMKILIGEIDFSSIRIS